MGVLVIIRYTQLKMNPSDPLARARKVHSYEVHPEDQQAILPAARFVICVVFETTNPLKSFEDEGFRKCITQRAKDSLALAMAVPGGSAGNAAAQ